jgi:Zn-dependent protease with chaperone function
VVPIRLEGLRPQAYEHPSDAAALDALTNTAGFDTFITKVNEWGIERYLRVQLTGSYLRVGPDNFPDLYRILSDVRDRLDTPVDIDLYIAPGAEINAFTIGVKRPLIVLTSPAVELLSLEELTYVIGHEVGHVKSGHVLYYQIADFLPLIAGLVGSVTFGFGEFFTTGIQMALLYWKRTSEYTADRAGLLACQNAEVAWKALMKLAGLPTRYYDTVNTEDFLKQAREFKDLDIDTLSKIAKWVSVLGATHPWTVERAQQLDEWIKSGSYEETLKFPRRTSVALPPGIKLFCTKCGRPLRGSETFCPGCGTARLSAATA